MNERRTNSTVARNKDRSGVAGIKSRQDVLKLRAVGDIALIGRAASFLEEYGYQYPFSLVADHIRSAELAFGNLEMPICSDDQCKPYFDDVCPEFRCPPQTVDALKDAGFDVINLANNHSMDWGVAGLRETLSRLRSVGLKTIGAGETLAAARQPAVVEQNGLCVGFIGYGVPGPWSATANRPGVAPIDRAMILDDVHALREKMDLLVVSLHTGILSDYPNPEDRRLARDLVDQGVDLILGHGPHVLQGVEIYRDRVIAYSLGNFIIDLLSGNVENRVALQEQIESIIFDVDLPCNGEPKVDYIPIRINESLQTVPANSGDAARIRARMETLSDNLERMRGLALWEHAGERVVEHELRVLAFQAREVGWFHVLKRLRKIRWRHIRLLLGYLFAQLSDKSRFRATGRQ